MKTPWTYDNLKAGTATRSGSSSWLRIAQVQINEFGKATLDPDPMHVDPVWSAKSSPYGTTIAFGFLTMSLLTHLLRDALGSPEDQQADSDFYPLNYGFDRLRLIAPIPVNSRIRGHFELLEARERRPNQLLLRIRARVEIEGEDRPALVAEWLTAYVSRRDIPGGSPHSQHAPA